MKQIFVYSFPRSGTNLFASYMNIHPNVYSINTGGGAIRNVPKDLMKNAIFANGVNFVKNDIKYILHDEIHPGKYNNDIKGITLIRSLDSINTSIKNMRKKLGHSWVHNINKGKHDKLIEIAQREDILGIYTESFILYPEKVLEMVCNHLSLHYKDDYFSFRWAVDQGCVCGSKFTTKETDEAVGETFKHDTPQTYWYCKKHDSVLSAWGGFNPHLVLDKGRVDTSKDWSIEKMNKDLNNI